MKKYLLFLPLLALAAPSVAQAEEASVAKTLTERPKWTLQVDPLTTALGYAHVHVERTLAPNWSLYVGPHIKAFDGVVLQREGEKPYRGTGIETGLRYYFSGTAPEGSWALVRGVGARVTQDGEDAVFGGYVSALGGYTAIFANHWVLSGGIGAQYLHYKIANSGPNRVFVAMHTALGVAF